MEKLKCIWKTAAALASDLGLPYTTVHSWFARKRTPATRDFDIIAAARRRGHELTLEDMAATRVSRADGAPR